MLILGIRERQLLDRIDLSKGERGKWPLLRKIMDDEIVVGGIHNSSNAEFGAPVMLVPMQIGNATVYIEKVKEGVSVEADDQIYPVAPSPQQAFETAIEALKECVRVVGGKLENLAGKAMPKVVEIEFSLTFDVKAKGALVPIFVTAEHGVQTGLKVKAVWKQAETPPGEG